mmetsp:Transcript_90063/g.142312  ORF Transcript_90063/g.142312 Transcript_90063/m.142312 type:complete len:115 (-) Transcript_90063:185-529(-)
MPSKFEDCLDSGRMYHYFLELRDAADSSELWKRYTEFWGGKISKRRCVDLFHLSHRRKQVMGSDLAMEIAATVNFSLVVTRKTIAGRVHRSKLQPSLPHLAVHAVAAIKCLQPP